MPQSSQTSQLWENNFIHIFSLSWPSQMFTRGWKPLLGPTQVERIDNTHNNFQGISNDWLLHRFGSTDLLCSSSWEQPEVTGILSMFDSGGQKLHSDIFLALKIKSQFRVRKSILHGRDLGSTELILILTVFFFCLGTAMERCRS